MSTFRALPLIGMLKDVPSCRPLLGVCRVTCPHGLYNPYCNVASGHTVAKSVDISTPCPRRQARPSEAKCPQEQEQPQLHRRRHKGHKKAAMISN